jgi:lysophospholipase L1-like esterase
MRSLLAAICLTAMASAVRAEVLFTDSFEGTSRIPWQTSWGKVEPSPDFAQDGKTAMKETLEDAHGLSVLSVELEAFPKAAYRASAWVYVPTQAKGLPPCLSFNRMDWSPLAAATTAEKDTWVKLEVEYKGGSESRIRLQLYQDGQKAGLGGAVMYWDNVTVERELAEVKLEDGMRINPYVQEGLDVTPAGGLKVRVAPGKMAVGGQVVEVAQETVLELAAPRVLQVRDEAKKLTDQMPQSYHGGTALQQCTIEGGIGLAGALAPESLRVKSEPGPAGKRLEEGKDWRADTLWGRLGRLPDGAIGPDTTVYVDYDWSLQRVDTIAVRSDGKVVLRQGAEDKTIPVPPQVDQFAQPLCNLFLPFHCREITPELIYPIGPPFPSAAQGEVDRNAALIPKTLAKLQKGGDFTLLFWGDSVTCGGTASTPAKAFPQAFTTWLRDKYPQASIRYVNAGTGGWNSDSKLPLFQSEVLDRKPDLVVIEFVNDMGMDRAHIFKNYTEALARLREIGSEVIILTPHFVRPDWMGAATMRTAETRATVGFLKEFAAENGVGLADASRRWEHLWIEGLPYLTLEFNAINHPDDRGHRLFVEELQKFFP